MTAVHVWTSRGQCETRSVTNSWGKKRNTSHGFYIVEL